MPSFELAYTIVDAFTSTVFLGNPAAVVRLVDTAVADATLQLIAREFNVGVTAFLATTQAPDTFDVRWFTPTLELALCGHASLASAHVLGLPRVVLQSRVSGALVATRGSDGTVELEIPAETPVRGSSDVEAAAGEALRKAFGLDAVPAVRFVGTGTGTALGGYILVHVDDALDLAAQTVDSAVLAAGLPGTTAQIITNAAPDRLRAEGKHFVSRVFQTPMGIPEDSVTGSSHCMLTPYWTERLGIAGTLSTRQVSERTGDLEVEWIRESGKVKIWGHAVEVAKGTMFVPSP